MDPVEAGERLWRDVYRRKMANAGRNRLENRHGQAIFVEAAPGEGISTHRYEGVDREFATAEGDRRAANVEGAPGVYGWCVVTVEAASGMHRRVEFTPLADDPYHADIHLPAVDNDGWEDASVHAIDLLAHSDWVDREGAFP